jgi:hypothetical protein
MLELDGGIVERVGLHCPIAAGRYAGATDVLALSVSNCLNASSAWVAYMRGGPTPM